MKERHILVVNPNCTQLMTDALKPQVESLGYSHTRYSFFTAPSGPKSINNDIDVRESVEACFKPLLELSQNDNFDGVLIACYSIHPLVSKLRKAIEIPVTGIFEASVTASLSYLDTASNDRFGIVSTGKIWETLLGDGVRGLLLGNSAETQRFAGVETTGLNATELHDLPIDEVNVKMKDATKRLITKSGSDVKAICLGCAGMVGLEQCVRQACAEELGHKGQKIHVVDGVKAGIGILQMLIRSGF